MGESFADIHYGESLGVQKAKANARRVRRRSQRQSWIRYMSSHSLRQRPVHNYGKKVKAANGIYPIFLPYFTNLELCLFLPQKKLLTFWVKLFRVYPVPPLIILVFSKLRGVQNVPR
ncbi:hypothetical protein TNCV_747071 [Trichonephila clavipes]|nr:hypothetical protein TNCV_747071 [Trichonephila clavipes]